MVVKCDNAESSKNVVLYMREMCTPSKSGSGVLTPGGTCVNIYEERGDRTSCEYIFMIPMGKDINDAISDLRNMNLNKVRR